MNDIIQEILIFLGGGLFIGFGVYAFTAKYYQNKLDLQKINLRHAGEHLDSVRETYREFIDRLQKRIKELENPPEPETILTNFQQPKDEIIARKLMELGKVPDCICAIRFENIADRTNVTLQYDIDCTVHYPHTSKFLGR